MKKLNKEKNKGTELTIFIICVSIVVFILFFVFYFEYCFEQEKDNDSTLNMDNSKVYTMEVSEAEKLLETYQYPLILANGDSFNSMTYYYSKDRILISNLSDEAKLLMAVQNSITSYYCNDENNICHIDEEIVKNKYKELFNEEYKYVKTNYFVKDETTLVVEPWNSYSNGYVYTKVTDAIYNETTLRIYVKVAFQYDTVLYYNYDLTSVIEEISTCKSKDDLDNYDNLNSYVYTFDIVNDNYILKSVEKN